jgi:hypothetical protein
MHLRPPRPSCSRRSARTLCAPRRAWPFLDRPRRSIGPLRTPYQNRRRRYRTRLRPHRTLPIFPRPYPRTRQASQPRRPHRRRRPRPAAPCRRRSRLNHFRTRLCRRRRSRRRMRALTRPWSYGEVGGAMGHCTICVSRVVARRGMPAWSVEQESRRRVSLCRAVARGASCRGAPRPFLPLPASPRPKLDCQRLHKAFCLFFQLSKWLLSLCISRVVCAKVSFLRFAILPPLPPLPSFVLQSSSFVRSLWKALGVTMFL